MIIWLNGTFGAGKTTTGELVAASSPGLRTFDPEWVGYLLRHNLTDHPVGDFQDYESWRRLVPVVADEIIRTTAQDLVAVQTVLDETYWDELRSRLADLGHEVFHVVLEADEDVLRRRIDRDSVEVSARQWRLDHLAVYAEARSWMASRADLLIDSTSLPPRDVAARIVAAVGEVRQRGLEV